MIFLISCVLIGVVEVGMQRLPHAQKSKRMVSTDDVKEVISSAADGVAMLVRRAPQTVVGGTATVVSGDVTSSADPDIYVETSVPPTLAAPTAGPSAYVPTVTPVATMTTSNYVDPDGPGGFIVPQAMPTKSYVDPNGGTIVA